MTNEGKLTIALLGCGGIARAHWRGIRYVATDLEVTAVIDSNRQAADAFAERTGAPAYGTLDEALADGDFDAVDIMLPHDLHEAAAVKCFEAGKHVVLEKPIAPDLATARRILDAGAAADGVFMVAEQAQYWPDVQKAKQLIDAGVIGEVVSARACFYDPLPVLDPDAPLPWRFSLARSGGGISIDGGAHWIRPLRIMLGEIDEVIATTSCYIDAMEGESIAHALFRFESGVTATFDALLHQGAVGPTEDFRITGTIGEIVLEHGRDGRLRVFTDPSGEGETVLESFQGKVDSYGAELADFASAVRHGTPLAAPPEFAEGELRTALAMYRSVATRRWESVWRA